MKFSEKYLKLCQRVYDLDQKAGIYMMFQIHETLTNRDAIYLDEAFSWFNSPQGPSFWSNLHYKLWRVEGVIV